MTIVREIRHGEEISDLISLAQNRTISTGVEHAIVRLGPNSVAPGARVFVSGGQHGILFAPRQITTLWGHTHPFVTGASRVDFQALGILGQSKHDPVFLAKETMCKPKGLLLQSLQPLMLCQPLILLNRRLSQQVKSPLFGGPRFDHDRVEASAEDC